MPPLPPINAGTKCLFQKYGYTGWKIGIAAANQDAYGQVLIEDQTTMKKITVARCDVSVRRTAIACHYMKMVSLKHHYTVKQLENFATFFSKFLKKQYEGIHKLYGRGDEIKFKI